MIRVLSLISICSILPIHAMENQGEKKAPQKALLVIDSISRKKTACYAPERLRQKLHAIDIKTNPDDLFIPVKTIPHIAGMPSLLPVDDLLQCPKETTLPFIINDKEVVLTLSDNPESPYTLEADRKECIDNFNTTPRFASTHNNTEDKELKKRLEQKGLLTTKSVQLGLFKLTSPIHGENFKPHTTHPKSHYRMITDRSITGKIRSSITGKR